jgi:heme-degrading monooxygenase HmoA
MFEARWEFEVSPGHRDKFVATYGSDGPWVQLFRQGAGYLGTELIEVAPTRWVTVDRWTSRASYEAFQAAFAAEYAAIDARCGSLTIAERKLSESGD